MRRRPSKLRISAVAVALLATPAAAQESSTGGLQDLNDWKSANIQITGHVLEPEQLEPSEDRLAQLNLPAGFEIGVFARDLINPRTLAVADDGTVYVTRREVGDLVMLRDEDGDGRADLQETVATRPMMHGIAIDGDTVYLVTVADNEQAEELNHILEGHKYGWPYVFDDSNFNPQDEPSGEISMEEWAAESTEPIGLYTPHAAPMQLAWYVGDQFPQAYQGDAFVAMRGSWNRKPPSGYEVLRIRFEDGRPAAFEPFVTGFLMQTEDGSWGHLGRLAGLAMAADGALLLADDTNGVIYRISYTGDETAEQQAPEESTNLAAATVEMIESRSPDREGNNADELATNILGADSGGLELTSPAWKDGDPIPAVYAADHQDISPPLAWSSGPEATQSYALLMEDPDVAEGPPFVHWMLYNIPAGTKELREGVPGAPRLALPEGALQGANDRGSTGYAGMKPPRGDPAHHYHVQVFALDTELNLPHGATRAQLLQATQGHVLAAGALVGTYEQP